MDWLAEVELGSEILAFTVFVEQYAQFVIVESDGFVKGYWPEDTGSGNAMRLELGSRAFTEMHFQNCTP